MGKWPGASKKQRESSRRYREEEDARENRSGGEGIVRGMLRIPENAAGIEHKECPDCHAEVLSHKIKCWQCGYEF